MKHRSNAGSCVTCDYPKCTARYSTVSDVSVVRAQAEKLGNWAYVSGKSLRFGDGTALSSKKVDLCPEHKPKPRSYA